MTREEEAVKELIDMANALCLNPDTPQGMALKMAIKALSQQTEDAISRQTVLDLMQLRMGGKELYMAVYELPSVNPQPKTGHWVESTGYDDRDHFYVCSECGRYIKLICGAKLSDYPYCHCGAKMVEPQESEDKCKKCEYFRNPDYTRCHECKAEESEVHDDD